MKNLMMKYGLVAFLGLFMLNLISCGGDDNEQETLKPINDVTINYGQEWFVNEIGNKAVTFENGFIASFKDGKLFGDHVGKTSATTSDGRKFNVKVNSTVSQIKDLEIDWDKDADWYSNNSPFGPMRDNGNYNETVLTYQDPITKIAYAYTFFPGRGKLRGAGILVPFTYASQLGTYLKERFIPLSTESISDNIFLGGFNAYEAKNATMAFAVTLPSTSAYQVTIVNPKDASSASTRSLESGLLPFARDIEWFE